MHNRDKVFPDSDLAVLATLTDFAVFAGAAVLLRTLDFGDRLASSIGDAAFVFALTFPVCAAYFHLARRLRDALRRAETPGAVCRSLHLALIACVPTTLLAAVFLLSACFGGRFRSTFPRPSHIALPFLYMMLFLTLTPIAHAVECFAQFKRLDRLASRARPG